jgi:hypothetical protein
MRPIATRNELRSIKRSVQLALHRRLSEVSGFAKHEDKILHTLLRRLKGSTARHAAILEWGASDDCGIGKRRLLRRLGAEDLEYQFDVCQALGCFRILVSFPDFKDISFSAAPPIGRAVKGALKRSDLRFFIRVGEILLGKARWAMPTELPKLDQYLLAHWVDKNDPLYNLTMKQLADRCERALKREKLSPSMIDKTRDRLGLQVLRRHSRK